VLKVASICSKSATGNAGGHTPTHFLSATFIESWFRYLKEPRIHRWAMNSREGVVLYRHER
jgi:hypothetical protein